MAEKHAFRNLSSSAIWLNCALWAQHKKDGTKQNPRGDESAADRGTMLHKRIEKLIQRGHRGKIDARGLDEHDTEQLENALNQTWVLLDQFPGAKIGTEVEVSLSYEPESKARIDLMAYDPNNFGLIVADHKFGVGEVTLESTQVRGYGAEAATALRKKGLRVEEVTHGIIQPALSDTPLQSTTSIAEVDRFQGFVQETVRRQESGAERRPAAELSVCQWCPFTLNCDAHKRLLGEAMDDAEPIAAGTAFPETLSRFYSGKGVIEEALKAARLAILEDEAAFPGWKRTERKAARAWDTDVRSEEEIVEALKALGREDFLRLKTPTQVGVDESIETLLKKAGTVRVLSKEKK